MKKYKNNKNSEYLLIYTYFYKKYKNNNKITKY